MTILKEDPETVLPLKFKSKIKYFIKLLKNGIFYVLNFIL